MHNMVGTDQFILLVEDDLDDQLLFQEAFRQVNSGLDLFMISEPLKAVKYLETMDKQPCLIVLDYNMPAMNGAEFLQAIKSKPQIAAIPTVMLSTSTIGNEHCKELGALDCFIKPQRFSDLIDIVEKALTYREVVVSSKA